MASNDLGLLARCCCCCFAANGSSSIVFIVMWRVKLLKWKRGSNNNSINNVTTSPFYKINFKVCFKCAIASPFSFVFVFSTINSFIIKNANGWIRTVDHFANWAKTNAPDLKLIYLLILVCAKNENVSQSEKVFKGWTVIEGREMSERKRQRES